MISLLGVPLTKKDIDVIEQAVKDLEAGVLSPGDYNSLILSIKLRNTKQPTRWQKAIRFIREKYWVLSHRTARSGVLVSNEVYRERLSACGQCAEMLIVPPTGVKLCKLCGCLLQAKARMAESSCPAKGEGQLAKGKWLR